MTQAANKYKQTNPECNAIAVKIYQENLTEMKSTTSSTYPINYAKNHRVLQTLQQRNNPGIQTDYYRLRAWKNNIVLYWQTIRKNIIKTILVI